MSISIKKGLSFGLTSGVITTLGMIVGVNASTNSRLAVIAAIVAIAIADAFSDSVAMHVSEESEGIHSKKDVWEATLVTFLTKFIFALTFVIPIWFLPLDIAVIADIIWGLLIMIVFNTLLAQSQEEKVLRVVFEHLVIAIIVIIVTYIVGSFLSTVV
ncbi:MAG: VIT1/CCC1 transporter family protein [Candidatus Odinarchaeota archaeon]